ncbi:hypothetical protein B9Z55_009091 [Caenorhabditis nigoni]|nr:hypothetical protein B9Z55_009091 [Caenorhabditis nigoni]
MRTASLVVDLQKALTADSFPLESLEIDSTLALVSSAEAKTVITTRSPQGIQTSDIHRIYIKYCTIDWLAVMDLIRNWQNSDPEIGRHYSMETESVDLVMNYISVVRQSPGAQINKRLASGISPYGFTFPINQEKVLNVFLDRFKKENGMEEYVIHFKIDPVS